MSNVPKLRFKGFENNWRKVFVGDIYEFKNGLNKGKDYFGQGTPIVNFKDVFNNRGLSESVIKGKVTLTRKEIENYNVKKGDLFFTRTSEIIDEIGYPSVMLEEIVDCVFSGFVLRARAKDPKYDLDHLFKKYVFFTPSFRKEMIRKSSMTTRALTSGTAIKKMEVKIPQSMEEQFKIGDLFSLLELKIIKQQEKIELLKEQKKGYMQKIFNRELRLNDGLGRNFPEWKVVKIGDVFSERTEKGNESYELLSVTLEQGVIRRSQIDAKDNSNPNKSKYKVVNKGDIVYNSMRMWQGANGVSSYEGIVSPAYTVLIPSEKIYPLFIGYLFKHDRMIYEFKRYSQGLTSDTWNLKYPQISEIKVKLPCKSEQERIGQFFNLIDRKIKFETKKLNEMIQKKKFFMQNMFL